MWAFIVSIIALVVALMALPTVFQMIWGRPKIFIQFTDTALSHIPSVRVLWCELTNPPMINPLLKRFFIRRMPAEDVVVHYSIRDTPANNLVFEAAPYIAEYPQALASSRRIRLTASGTPYTFRIVTVDTGKGEVFAIPKDDEKLPICSGIYSVLVEATVDGDKFYQATRRFVVRDTYPYVHWEL